MVGCQPWALEVVGSNPAGPIFVVILDQINDKCNKSK
jgi:hypothetical protein